YSASNCLVYTDAPPTAIYTLSLHDALPILRRAEREKEREREREKRVCRWPDSHSGSRKYGHNIENRLKWPHPLFPPSRPCPHTRSEEHTSELQSRENLVCRLLLEKKKKTAS